jgi:uroporphyrinogen-III decarboxylase
MNASQRFLNALKGKAVDRIPVVPKIWVDFSANVTGTDLKDIIQDPSTALRVIALAGKKLELDAVRQFHFPAKKIVEENGEIFEINKSGKKIGKIDMAGGLGTHLFDSKDYKISVPYTMAYCHSWSAPEPVINSIEDVKQMAIPDAALFDELGWAKRQKAIIDEFGKDLYLIGNCDTATIAFYIAFRGINNAMMDLVLQPNLVHAVLEKGTQIAINKGKYWLDMGINVLRLNDSAGNMSLISPQHWKEFVFPYFKTICTELHNYNKNAIIYCHICGNVLPIIDLLVESGLDCIAPLDPLGGFNVKQVREKAGDNISLMGGVNALTLLNGSPKEIMDEAYECMGGAGTKGGFVLGSGCVVPRNTPSKNITALVNAAKQFKGK